jgi:hypothetical protein
MVLVKRGTEPVIPYPLTFLKDQTRVKLRRQSDRLVDDRCVSMNDKCNSFESLPCRHYGYGSMLMISVNGWAHAWNFLALSSCFR